MTMMFGWEEIGKMLLLAFIGWAPWVTHKLSMISSAEKALLHMHENPDDTGFGTNGITRVIRDNARATRELSHYIQWSIEHETGTKPPPFVEPPGTI